jgi:hypothetical protein
MPLHKNHMNKGFKLPQCEKHFHDHDETWIILKGKGTGYWIDHDGRREEFVLEAGDVWMVPAGYEHGSVGPNSDDFAIAVFNGTERNVLCGGNYGGRKWPNRCGYQNVGRILEVGPDVTGFSPGDLVFSGDFCQHRQYFAAPARADSLIVKLPAEVEAKHAALFGVAGVAMHDVRRTEVRLGERILVVGAGPIGQFTAQAARLAGAHVTVCDLNGRRLSIARDLGAQRTVKRYDFVQKVLAGGSRYSTKAELRKDKPDEIEVVLDDKTGGRYRDDPGSPILIMGDSNLMMNMGPTGGHMPAHVARHIGLPLTFVAPTFGDAPAKVRNQLGGKRVVIWAQIARTLMGKWPAVDLGPAPGGQATGK